MTYDQARLLMHRYVRRFMLRAAAVDSLRLARSLERYVARDARGPVARAILQSIVIDVASLYGMPARE